MNQTSVQSCWHTLAVYILLLDVFLMTLACLLTVLVPSGVDIESTFFAAETLPGTHGSCISG
jgi:hypothetical protein